MHGVHGFGDLLHGLEGSHSVQVTWQEFRDTRRCNQIRLVEVFWEHVHGMESREFKEQCITCLDEPLFPIDLGLGPFFSSLWRSMDDADVLAGARRLSDPYPRCCSGITGGSDSKQWVMLRP